MIRSRRARIALVWLVFGGIALLGLGYVGADYWGKRQAREYLEKAKARGEAMTLDAYFDRGVPEEENVFAHPAMVEEMEDEALGRLEAATFSLPRARSRPGRSFKTPKSARHLTPGLVRRLPGPVPDLAKTTPVQDWFHPRLGLSEPEVARKLIDDLAPKLERGDAVAEALARPRLEWPGGAEFRDGRETPRLVRAAFRLREIADFYLDTAVLFLAAEQPDRAKVHVIRALQAAEHCVDAQPSGVSAIMPQAILGRVRVVLQEGSTRHAWTPDQLNEIARHFEGTRSPVELLIEVAETETVLIREHLMERLQEGWNRGEIGQVILDADGIGETLTSLWERLKPPGLVLADEVGSLEVLQRHAGELRENRRIAGIVRDYEREFRGSNFWFLVVTARGIANAHANGALAKTGVALERFSLSEGEYPATLDALVPDFLSRLPTDPWSGDPIQYERLSNGGPRAWSVGRDGVDKGGAPGHWELADIVWITRPIPGVTEADLLKR